MAAILDEGSGYNFESGQSKDQLHKAKFNQIVSKKICKCILA
jgi:hypothetical protein